MDNTQQSAHDDHDGRLPRRRFLRSTLGISASALLLPASLRALDDPFGACTPTSSDVEGPFYSSNAPFRVALAGSNEPGEVLLINGVVRARDCTTPLAGATVDVWGANDAGCYNRFEECTPNSDDSYNLRGRMLTDTAGAYAFSTIKPGRYLNGTQLRPSHVHFRVTVPGARPLITQLYFEGDPYIANDPFASPPAAAPRIIHLFTSTHGLAGTFDITLDVAPPASGVEIGIDRTAGTRLLRIGPNPFVDNTTITYSIAKGSLARLVIYDTLGRRVRLLVDSVHGSGTYTEPWDGRDDTGTRLPPGRYVCRLQVGGVVDSIPVVLHH